MSGSDNNIGLKLTGDPSGLQRALAQGGKAVADFGKQAERDLKGVGDAAERTGKQALSLNDVMALFTARSVTQFGFKALTGELTQFEQVMVTAQTQAQKLRTTLTFSVGKEGAARDMVFLRETARDLGLEFVSTAGQYARLAAAARGSNMEGRQTRELFEAIAQASAVLSMSVDESEGAFRAVQQMMSKGQVQAEELRGQLGERLPGAFQIAARSMNVTTAELGKMLERGEVMADEFLPRFAAQLKKEMGGSVAEAAATAQAATNRFTNSFTEMKMALADAGFYDFVASRQATVAESFRESAAAMREAKAEGAGFFATLFAGFAADIGLRNPLTGISASAKDNATELAIAKKRLEELQAQSGVMGSNIYWRAERAEIQQYIADLEKALGKKAALTEKNPADAYFNYPSRSQSFEKDDRRQAGNRASLDAINQQLSGQNQSYQKNLQQLYKLWVEGTIKTEAEYVGYVKRLIEQQGGVKKQNKLNPADALFRGISERTAELRAEISAEKDLTAAQKQASKILDDLRTGTLTLTTAEKARMGVALTALLTEDKANTEREAAIKLQAENTKIIQKNSEAASKAVEAGIKALEIESQTNDKLREEISLIGLDERQRATRLQVIEQETIARLEQALVVARLIEGNDAEISRLEREIELRKERAALIGKKGDAEEFQRSWESVDRTAHDVFTNIFEGGSNVFKKLGQVLKASLLDLLYQMVVKKWVFNILASVTGGAGAAGTVANIAGNGGSSILSNLSSASSLYNTGSGIVSSIASGYTIGAGAGASYASTIGAGLATDAMGATVIADAAAAGITTGLSGAVSSALSAIPVYGWIALAGLAVLSMIGGGETRSGGQYEMGKFQHGPSGGQIGGDKAGPASLQTAASINGILNAIGSKSLLTDFSTGVESSENGKGFAYAGGRLNTGAVFGQGRGPLFAEDGINNRRGDLTPEQAMAAFGTELKQVTLQALQAATDVPESIMRLLKGKDFDKMADAELDPVLTAVNNVILGVGQFRASIELLPFEKLAGQSFDFAASLGELSGGMDKFLANLSGYFQNYYTPQEQRQQTAKNIQGTLHAAGADFSIDDILKGDRTKFRQVVEAYEGRTDEAGKKIYVALLSVQGAFASLTPEAEKAAESIDTVTQTLRDAADIAREREGLEAQLLQLQGNTAELRRRELDVLDESNRALQQHIWNIEDARAATDAAFSALERAVDGQRTALQQQRQITQETANDLRGLFSVLDNSVRSLYGQVDGLQGTTAGEGRQFIAQALASAIASGYLPEQGALSGAIQGATGGLDARNYSSAFELNRDRLVLAGQLHALQDLTGDQLSTAELQLRAEQDALDRLDTLIRNERDLLEEARTGIRPGLLGIEDAVRDLHAAMFKETGKKPGATGTTGGGGGASFGPGDSGSNSGITAFQLTPELLGNTAGYITFSTGPGFDFSAFAMANLADPQAIADKAKGWGLTEADIAALMGKSEQDVATWFALQGVPAFAAGGIHLGGWAMVGEQGPELAYLPPARIYNAQQTQSLAGAGDGTAGAAFDANRQAEARAIVSQLSQIRKFFDQWDLDGLPVTRIEA